MKGSVEIGKTYDFQMKPAIMRGWKVIRATTKCIVVDKKRGSKNPKFQYQGEIYIPRRQIAKASKVRS
jgi:hypothetical protein